jgi:hypothetical protein
MEYPQLVLNNDLLALYVEIKDSGISPENSDRVQKLFSFYKNHAVNEQQYKQIGVKVNDSLSTTLRNTSYNNIFTFQGSLEDLSQLTRLKIILNENRSDFPYVNINKTNELLEVNYSGTFNKCSREKCINHLKAICKSAETVEICDRYLYKDREAAEEECISRSIERVKLVLSLFDKSITQKICFIDFYYKRSQDFNNSPFKKVIDALKPEFSNIDRIRHDRDSEKMHDRYIKVKSTTGNLEIILSSGFDNLFSEDKDFTYIVRCVD